MNRGLQTLVGSFLAFCVATAGFGLASPAAAQSEVVSGTVVDGRTGEPLPGVAVALLPTSAVNGGLMSKDAAPAAAAVATTDAAGRFLLESPGAPYFLNAYGASVGRVTFHGTFYGPEAGTIRLLRPTNEERRALAQLNAFRATHGIATMLGFDENLMESARYWASVEGRAQHVGHTCASVGSPKGCIEFNTFYHALPGAPREWFCGQNAAFDTVSSWNDPDRGFEAEEHQSGDRGHYLNIISANRWIGFGKAGVPGIGTYFAMNVL